MDYSPNSIMDKDFLDQQLRDRGFGAPEPVGDGGAKAGPTRPSASYCQTLSVGVQAGMLDMRPGTNLEVCTPEKAFGDDGSEFTPSQNQSLVERSLPDSRRGSIGSLSPDTVMEYQDCALLSDPSTFSISESDKEETSRDKKRKRTSSPEQMRRSQADRALFLQKVDLEYNMHKDLLHQIMVEVGTLVKVIKEIPNTKKEIKSAISTLGDYMKRMPVSMQFIPDIIAELTDSTSVNVVKETIDVGTQTISRQQEEKERLIGELDDHLNSDLTGPQLHDIMATSWPEEVYKSSSLKHGDVLKCADEDIILITKGGDEPAGPLMNKILCINPQIQGLLDEGKLNQGKMVCSKTSHETLGDDFETRPSTRYIYLIPMEDGGVSVGGTTNLILNLERVLAIVRKNGRTNTSCVVTKQVDEVSVRKVLEYFGRRHDIPIPLYSHRERQSRPATAMEEVKKRRAKQQDTLILKPIGERTYADIMKNIKQNVSTQGVLIDQKSKNRDGSVQLRIKGNNTAERLAFKELMTAKLENIAEVRLKASHQTIMILDIDETVQEAEVQAALKRELPVNDEISYFKLAEKPNAQGVRYAFASINLEAAKRLVTKKRIGDGWDRWRIKEVTTLSRCFKCSKVGHKARECVTKQTEQRCHNCGEIGHKLKECLNSTHCYLCQSKEHRAETMRCPEYRRLLRAQEGERRKVSPHYL